jgi:hypothetical protein
VNAWQPSLNGFHGNVASVLDALGSDRVYELVECLVADF